MGTAWWQEVITASVCTNTPQFSSDRHLSFAYSRPLLSLALADFFQEGWQEACTGLWLHQMKQIAEAKAIRLSLSEQPVFSPAHYCAIHPPRVTHGCAQAALQEEALAAAVPSPSCCAQPKLLSALQRYLKTLLEATAPKAALFPWATAPGVDAVTQLQSYKSQFTYKLAIQLVPSACRWLHITQPLREEPAAPPPCSGSCFSQHRVGVWAMK